MFFLETSYDPVKHVFNTNGKSLIIDILKYIIF